jgi:hypothetical protein
MPARASLPNPQGVRVVHVRAIAIARGAKWALRMRFRVENR